MRRSLMLNYLANCVVRKITGHGLGEQQRRADIDGHRMIEIVWRHVRDTDAVEK